MAFRDFEEAVNAVYASFNRALWARAGFRVPGVSGEPPPGRWTGRDEEVRRPELTGRLLDFLGRPDRAAPSVLVAGSKGKGSTARMIAAILGALGFRVGLFTGPHLIHPMERIVVDGRPMPEADFVRWMNEIFPLVQRVGRELAPWEYVAPVGIYLAVAACYFREQRTDVNVLECGRGARYDDVPRAEARWGVVTPVMEEHLRELGPRLTDVARHKAGVIRPGMAGVFVARQRPEVREILFREAERQGVPLYVEGEDFAVVEAEAAPEGLRTAVRTPEGRRVDAILPLFGRFQAENAAVAVAAAEQIAEALPGRQRWSPDRAAEGLAAVSCPGRCEILSWDPWVLLDGAVTRESAAEVRRLAESRGGRVTVVAAVPSDKDYRGVYEALAPVGEGIILTRAGNRYFRYPEDGPAVAGRYYARVETAAGLEEAWRLARSRLETREGEAGASRGIVLVGAQPFVAEVLQFFNHIPRGGRPKSCATIKSPNSSI